MTFVQRLTPVARTKEYFLPSDGAIGAYRDRITEWEARGWRIDSKEVRKNELKVAYAIPSPGRRTAKNWVLDAVPLVDSTAAEVELAKVSSQ